MAAENTLSLQIMDAMIQTLKDHAWQTITPSTVISGPVPPGWIDFPAIGVLAGDSLDDEEHSDLRYADAVEQFLWELVEPLKMGELSDQFRDQIRWRSEAVRIARKAVNGHWGLSGGTVRMSRLVGWEPSLLELPSGKDAVQYLISTTIRTEVAYREQVQ